MTNLRPLTLYAVSVLKMLSGGAVVPRLEINNGCVDRLLREELIEIVLHPSQYAIDRGKPRDHVKITTAGKERITACPPKP